MGGRKEKEEGRGGGRQERGGGRLFLSDPSPTIGNLVDLTDVTLAFEDANSKLLDVVSVADVDAEERVDDGLVAILKLRFG